MSENNVEVMQGQPAISDGPIDDTYTITVKLHLAVPLKTIVDDLQAAFDSGAAGCFDVYPETPAGDAERTIVFTRYAYEDEEYVEPRTEGGKVPVETAACLQLAAELEDAPTAEVVTLIANALRDGENRPAVQATHAQALALFCTKQLAQEEA